ncbi:MAG: hypothetical protein AB2A00_32290 [Myxococcota bacterium]
MRNVSRSFVVFTAWLGLSCTTSGSAAPVCSFADLVPPTTPCNQFPDSAFEGVCVVDCLGNVFPEDHGEKMLDVPDQRFLAVIFTPHPGQELDPRRAVNAFVGRNNINGPDCCPENSGNNRVRVETSLTEDGSLFVKIDHLMEGPVQFSVLQDFGDVGGGRAGYAFRAYSGGEPAPLGF